MIWYTKELQNVFDTLLKNKIRPVIVGGYVRDFLLHKNSKDIDIELYGISSYKKLENLLKVFGSVNSVGKSFGICKLQLNTLEVDFSFPRLDSKISSGHKGFDVTIDTNLDFKTATSRRDFTINSIGYDVQTKKILDPFNGLQDLQAGVLQAVDLNKFADDPLRVLRAVQFSARFDFQLDDKLFELCKEMTQMHLLKELPKERILEEMKKLFFLSSKISQGFILLQKFGAFHFFTPLDTLQTKELKKIYHALDKIAQEKKEYNKTDLTIMFALVCYYFTPTQVDEFLAHFTNNKKIIDKVSLLVAHKNSLNFYTYSDYDLYTLATKINLQEFLFFLSMFEEDTKLLQQIKKIKLQAKKLQVLEDKMPNLLQGRDLLALGIPASKLFKTILQKAYEAQMRGEFSSKEGAINYCKNKLIS